MNLLEETVKFIEAIGQTCDDIIFIGSIASGHCCDWVEFKIMADIEYYHGYGSQKIASDIIIVFIDGLRMYRDEYDGYESWSYIGAFKRPQTTKKIRSLLSDSGWESLGDING